jgi:hypothetical protein
LQNIQNKGHRSSFVCKILIPNSFDRRREGPRRASSGIGLHLNFISGVKRSPFSPYGDATVEAKIRASIGRANTGVLRLRAYGASLRMTADFIGMEP